MPDSPPIRDPDLDGTPRSLADIDWIRWRAVDLATLTFVVRSDAILLIRKKRGLGAGKINGPGGRLEPGERPIDCAVREVEEEIGVTPLGLRACGELQFQFIDGYSIHVHVFSATDCRGELRETDEAIPLWTAKNEIPYAEMWEDDELWLPLLLAGERFSGRFLFDGDRMLDHRLDSSSSPSTPASSRKPATSRQKSAQSGGKSL